MTKTLIRSILTLLLPLLFLSASLAQGPKPEAYRVYDKAGQPASLGDIVLATQGVEVLFLGENHNDATAHLVQAELLKLVNARWGATRKVALSLEMLERDSQTVLEEYLANIITEAQFLAASRPWKNYASDYRPAVEMAKTQKLPVLAANVPQRYANLVSRQGRSALEALSPLAKSWMAPLPYPAASAAYSAKFLGLMGKMGGHGQHMNLDRMLDAQVLRDATMAHSITQHLATSPSGLIVHWNGNFHSEGHLGTVEQLPHYRPGTKALVVTIISPASFPLFDKATHGLLGDFVVLTDPQLPRSQGG